MTRKTEKRLADALREMSANRKVKIGTENGGAYFIAGNATEILLNLKELDSATRKAWKVKVANAETNLRTSAAAAPTYAAYLSRTISKNFDRLQSISDDQLSYESYLREVKLYRASIRRKINNVQKLRDIISKYTPINTRKVIEIRTALPSVDEDTTIIMIDGYETGKVWMFSEVSNGKLLYINEGETEQEDE